MPSNYYFRKTKSQLLKKKEDKNCIIVPGVKIVNYKQENKSVYDSAIRTIKFKDSFLLYHPSHLILYVGFPGPLKIKVIFEKTECF